MNLSFLNLEYTVLVNKCKWYEAWENEYKQFHDLADIKDSQVDDYLVKLPLYVQGSRDAHILLSATDKPNWATDYAYEIGINLLFIYVHIFKN